MQEGKTQEIKEIKQNIRPKEDKGCRGLMEIKITI